MPGEASEQVDEMATARSLAREMDAEDRRAKIAARSQQDGSTATALPPTTALGRGLSRGNSPRRHNSSPKRPQHQMPPPPPPMQLEQYSPPPPPPPSGAASVSSGYSPTRTTRRGLAGKRGVTGGARANRPHHVRGTSTGSQMDSSSVNTHQRHQSMDYSVDSQYTHGARSQTTDYSQGTRSQITDYSQESQYTHHGDRTEGRHDNHQDHNHINNAPQPPPALSSGARRRLTLLERDSIVENDVAKHMDMLNLMDMDVSELGMDTSGPVQNNINSINRKVRPAPAGSMMTKLGPAVATGSYESNSAPATEPANRMVSSSGASVALSSAQAPPTTTARHVSSGGLSNSEYRTKGLARPPPSSAMTRLEPATTLGSRATSGGSIHRATSTGSSAPPMTSHASRAVSSATTISSMSKASSQNSGYFSENNPAANDDANSVRTNTTRNQDRNELRRLKFNLLNSVGDSTNSGIRTPAPQTIVTPVLPPQEAQKGGGEGSMLSAPGSFQDEPATTTTPTKELMDNSSRRSHSSRDPPYERISTSRLDTRVESRAQLSIEEPLPESNPALAPSAPTINGPGAYRVELQQQQAASQAAMMAAAAMYPDDIDDVGSVSSRGSHASQNRKLHKLSTTSKLVICGAFCVVVAGAAVGAVLAMGGSSGGDGGGGEVGAGVEASEEALDETILKPIETFRPEGMDIYDWVWSLLPNVTIQAIDRDANSSQADAMDWLLQDPAVEDYASGRLLQRLSLATLYFATNGDQWEDRGSWLSYGVHECSWTKDRACEDADKEGAEFTTDAKIMSLKITKNKAQGYLPPEISFLTNLETLDLSENNVRGSIPSQIGLLTALQELTLDLNHFTGPIPNALGQLTNMVYLALNNNQLTGSLPSEVGSLVEMSNLFLHHNQIAGPIPTTIGKLGRLSRLDLSSNSFFGPLPSEVGNLRKLVQFLVDSNRFSGPMVGEISQISTLRNLVLSNNKFTGTIPPLEALSSLQELVLSNNTFSDTIPRQLPLKLKSLGLGHGGFRGSIHTEVGLLTNLNHLHLFKGAPPGLTGTIPTELGLCSNMILLELDFNQLSGTIPAQLGAMSNLERLWVYMNPPLTGPIPSELGQCSMLKYLYLDRTRLSGTIPPELNNLGGFYNDNLPGNLHQMNIANTDLTGTMPFDFCNTPEPSSFDCGEVCGCDCPCA